MFNFYHVRLKHFIINTLLKVSINFCWAINKQDPSKKLSAWLVHKILSENISNSAPIKLNPLAISKISHSCRFN